jgi:hypothetical protein
MFARAVVVKLARRAAFAIELASNRLAVRYLRATQQVALAQTYPIKHSRNCFGVNTLALMGRATDSQFTRRELEAISRAARDQRNGLNGLDRRAGRGSELVIAKAGHDAAVRLDDHNYSPVTSFYN